MVVILIPVAVRGFYIKSFAYGLGTLFLYFAVGVAEEVCFRGIILNCLNQAFSWKKVIVLSTIIFGIGHITSAFTASNGWEVFLTVVNALIFGWLTVEMVMVCHSIIPGIFLHFLFDFETKIVVMSGNELLMAELVRGFIMVTEAVWLALLLVQSKKTK